MSSPLVSICIPSYKADKYLEAALSSVAAQTFTDWEVIVTEDGSKDRAEEITLAFAKTVFQSVTYNRHQANRGLPSTRNTGIATARGRWIAFLDADDLWKPDHLTALVSASTTGDFDLLYSGSILFDDLTGAEKEVRAPSVADAENLPVALYTGKLSIMPSSVMIRRESFDKFGPISNDFPICNDTEYWLRVLSKGGHLKYSGANTCMYRYHAASMSQKSAAILLESARLCEHYGNWAAIPRGIRRTRPANLYRWAGRTLLAENSAEARRVLVCSLRLQPLNAKTISLWGKALLKQTRSGSAEKR